MFRPIVAISTSPNVSNLRRYSRGRLSQPGQAAMLIPKIWSLPSQLRASGSAGTLQDSPDWASCICILYAHTGAVQSGNFAGRKVPPTSAKPPVVSANNQGVRASIKYVERNIYTNPRKLCEGRGVLLRGQFCGLASVIVLSFTLMRFTTCKHDGCFYLIGWF